MDHLSQGSVGMLSRCPRQFYYRYIEGWSIPPNAARQFGGAYHATMQFTFETKLTTEWYPSKGEVQQYFVDEWDTYSQEVEWKLEEEDKGALTDIGTGLVDQYVEGVAPNRHPKLVEQEFQIYIDGVSLPFVGVIDFIGDADNLSNVVLEHKTSSRSWSFSRVETELQTSAYHIAYQEMFGRVPATFIYDIAVKTKVPKIQTLETGRTPAQLEDYKERVRVVEQMIEKEVYPKTDPSNWYCSRKWCGYYEHCMMGIPLEKLRLRLDDIP